MPGFRNNAVNLDEARLDALHNVLATNVGDLDSLSQVGGLLPAGTITAAHILIGDVKSMPQVTDAPVLISVVGGGAKDAMDFEAAVQYVGLPTDGFKSVWHTNLFLYIHQDLFPAVDSTWAAIKAQADKRERLRARMCDWVRCLFNQKALFSIALGSQERSGAGDQLRGFVTNGYKGEFTRTFGDNQTLYGAHLVHVGRIE